MNDTPSGAANFALMQARIKMRAAEARKAEDWFDIFQDVVYSGVRQTLGPEQSSIAHGLLKEQDYSFTQVRDKLRVQGLDIGGGVEWEGPEIGHNGFGIACIMGWPRGMWAEVTWGDKSKIKFVGKQAEIAVSFFIWWTSFHQVYMETTQPGVIISEATKRRLIEPGTSDWLSYNKGKADDVGSSPP